MTTRSLSTPFRVLRNYSTPPICQDSAQANSGSGDAQFTLSSMIGPLLLLVLGATVSFIQTRLDMGRRKATARMIKELDTDGDGKISKAELEAYRKRRVTALKRSLTTNLSGKCKGASASAAGDVTAQPMATSIEVSAIEVSASSEPPVTDEAAPAEGTPGKSGFDI